MTKLLYNPRKGWFQVWDVATGRVHLATGITIPDEYGCYWHRLLVPLGNPA